MNKNLVTITPYGRSGASSRVRVFDWLDHLAMPAVSYTYLGAATSSPRTLLSNPIATTRAEYFTRRAARGLGNSNLLLSKFASPLSSGRVESRLLASARASVYDFDDAIMLARARGVRRLASHQKAWAAAVRASTRVIAGNNWLADRALELVEARKISIIPSCVEPLEYEQKAIYAVSGRPRVVWLGSPSTEVYLHAIADALLKLNHSFGLRLTVISAGGQDLGRLNAIVDRIEWRKTESARSLASFDLGIMPLPDDPFARGKCAYKLLQYGASGLPSLASPVGTNIEVARDGGTLLAKSNAEWVDSITNLLRASPREREAIGIRALNLVRQKYSFRANSEHWQSVVLSGGVDEP